MAEPKPALIEYRTRTRGVVLVAVLLPREGLPPMPPALEYRARRVPRGVIGWPVPPAEGWRPIEELPPEWGIRR